MPESSDFFQENGILATDKSCTVPGPDKSHAYMSELGDRSNRTRLDMGWAVRFTGRIETCQQF